MKKKKYFWILLLALIVQVFFGFSKLVTIQAAEEDLNNFLDQDGMVQMINLGESPDGREEFGLPQSLIEESYPYLLKEESSENIYDMESSFDDKDISSQSIGDDDLEIKDFEDESMMSLESSPSLNINMDQLMESREEIGFTTQEVIIETSKKALNNITVTDSTNNFVIDDFDIEIFWEGVPKGSVLIDGSPITTTNLTTIDIPSGSDFTNLNTLFKISIPKLDNYEILASYTKPSATGGGEGQAIRLNLTIIQLPETKIEVQYLDLYKRPLDDNIITTSPQATLNFRRSSNPFDIGTSSNILDRPYVNANFRSDSITNLIGNSPNLSVVGLGADDILTIEDKEFKVETLYTVTDGGRIILTLLEDVIEDPPLEERLDGYVRLTFDPTNQGSLDGYSSSPKVYDVRKGLSWQKFLDGIGQVPSASPYEPSKQFESWNPSLPDGLATIEEDTSFIASYMDKDKILDVTDPTSPIPEGYVRLSFDASTEGTFDGGEKVKQIDVLYTLTYEDPDLKVKISSFTPKTGNSHQTFDKWNPDVPTDNTLVIEETYLASYRDLEIIGPVDESINPNPDPEKYWTVRFKSEDENRGTVPEESTFYVLKTANKSLADLKDLAPKANPMPGYTFYKWDPVLDETTLIGDDLDVLARFNFIPPTGVNEILSPFILSLFMGLVGLSWILRKRTYNE
ncbi:MAG: hypothetical protein Q4D88_04815 [Anaerococcus sp.]|nr:hypothetical protein [Anaerococcus sp.]